MSALGERHASISLDDARTDFLRYVRAEAKRVRLARTGVYLDAVEIAQAEKGVGSRLAAMFEMPDGVFSDYAKSLRAPIVVDGLVARTKASVAVGGIDVGWGGAPIAPFAQSSVAFLQSLAPYSSFDRIWNDNAFFPLPMRTRIAVATTAAVGSTVPEDTPKPVASMSFSQAQQPALKAVAEVVLSDEVLLLTTPSANRLFELEMQKSVAKATDAKFMSILSAGAGSTHASSGLSPAAFLSDLTTALQSIQTEDASRLYLTLPISTFKAVSLLRDTGGLLVSNGKIGNISVLASSGATTEGFLFDAANAIGADNDIAAVTVSNEATLVMQDNPTAADTHLLSLFQNNLTCIRCERFFSAVVLRANGIAKITGYS
jgi:hypothetical protein